MTSLLRGAGDVARGYRFLRAHPRLWLWVLAPAAITLILAGGALVAALWLAGPLVAWSTSHLPAFLAGWLGGLVKLAVVGAHLAVSFFLFVAVSGLIAGPFCEFLSEAVEERVTGQAPPGFALIPFVHGLLLSLAHASRRLIVYLFSLLLLFAVGALVPGVGTALAAAAGAYLTAQSAAYDCFDSVFGRRLWRYRNKTRFLRRHRGRTLGLGGAVALLMLVPVVNLVALGVGAAGATLAVLDLEKPAPARAVVPARARD